MYATFQGFGKSRGLGRHSLNQLPTSTGLEIPANKKLASSGDIRRKKGLHPKRLLSRFVTIRLFLMSPEKTSMTFFSVVLLYVILGMQITILTLLNRHTDIILRPTRGYNSYLWITELGAQP
jgi:hypothetical protein